MARLKRWNHPGCLAIWQVGWTARRRVTSGTGNYEPAEQQRAPINVSLPMGITPHEKIPNAGRETQGQYTARKRRRMPLLYWVCDSLTEVGLYLAVIFGPWALGTTQPWAIGVMNGIGSTLGILWITKRITCRITGYIPLRWNQPDKSPHFQQPSEPGTAAAPSLDTRRIGHQKRSIFLSRLLGLLTGLLLAYCFVSALNARATYHPTKHYLQYHQAISWLPHSYDEPRTWSMCWQYLGLAFVFWALRDWLLGLSRLEHHTLALHQDPPHHKSPVPTNAANATTSNTPKHREPSPTGTHFNLVFPMRLRRLLLVLFVNGTLLAAQGIIHKFSHSDKLLWIQRPRYEGIEGLFGPYAYRSNAAQYVNLIWPVCAGYLWVSSRQARQARRKGFNPKIHGHTWLTAGTILMAAVPIVSASRGGAFIALVQGVSLVAIMALAARRSHWRIQMGIGFLLILTLELAFLLGGDRLMSRLKGSLWEQYQIRQETVMRHAQQMASDFPVFGTGPGTFMWLYQFYLKPNDFWLAHVHNDWWETRITFGWIGLSLILLCLVPVSLHWFGHSGLPMPSVLAACIGLALIGCLLHAWIDFPLQIHSILCLFLILCGILSCTRRP